MKLLKTLLFLSWFAGMYSCSQVNKTAENVIYESKEEYTEAHRPLFHFSPDSMWMNDPNGMVFFEDEYHLFYQYYPDSTVWGPMHWGHAVSKDMINWEHLPVALYPDSLGYIFSGSAVVDKDNTSGLGTPGNTPMVAIFTYHLAEGEAAGRTDYQTQGIAYSNDKGRTWTKYEKNPVMPNPGIKDFRDPKVMWHEANKKWIMSLAAADRIQFYSSPDLIDWTYESDFGQNVGGHGGVWECPDLFPLTHEGKQHWVLLVSINPGGPNGGSATQYFVGDFNGKTFTMKPGFAKALRPLDQPNAPGIEAFWLDHGPDNYAGVTFGNVPDRQVFLGWMSNWLYGQEVPTHPWRSAMTLPRTLQMRQVQDQLFVTSQPVQEVEKLRKEQKQVPDFNINQAYNLSEAIGTKDSLFELSFTVVNVQPFHVKLANGKGEFVTIGFDTDKNRYFIDRTDAGEATFSREFARPQYAERRVPASDPLKMHLFVDVSSIELFADDGLTVMTATVFPEAPFTDVSFHAAQDLEVKDVQFYTLKDIWK